MSWYTPEFIAAIPKTDLHVHLDGSLRIPTLIELANQAGVELPADDEAGLRRLVFKDNYANLDEYLRGFGLTCACMQTATALERVARELLEDNAAEGVRYIEVRFAPQLHMSPNLSFIEVMQAVDKGLRSARDSLNAGLKADEPAYDYGIIACAMRFFTPGFSQYYRDFCRMHEFSSQIEIIKSASLELAKAVVKLRSESEIQIVAFDLAGSEYGYPASDHAESYAYVNKHFIDKTVHAGEAFGPESIFQAVTKLHADRIGHGLHLFNADMIHHTSIANQQKYIKNLVNYLADRRLTIEVCLTSNMQTSPQIGALTNHSLRYMLDNKLSVSFCTDNRLVSNTTVSQEIKLALDNFPIDAKTLKNIIIYGFKRSFYYHSYPEKRNYVRRIINYYEALEKKFGISS